MLRHTIRLARPAITCLVVSVAFICTPVIAFKTAGGFSNNWDTLDITTQQLAEHVYYLHASGGNMVLSVGPDGIVLVDNEFMPIADKILQTIGTLQKGPIRFVLNTHWHGDHTAMNAKLAETGAVIIAQDSSRERMLSQQYNAFFNSNTAPAQAAALPLISFPKAMQLHLNGESVQFFYTSPAHTDGDAVVWFPTSNVIHMGDIFINELYPIIDVVGGGDVNGYAPAIDAVLALINDDTKVVPGHGPVGDKTRLKEYRDMIETIRIRVQAMLDSGKDIDAILAARPSHEFDALWASDRVGPNDVVMMVYQSLSGDYLRSLAASKAAKH